MGTYKSSKTEASRAVALVGKIKEIANDLALAITHDVGLNKYRLDSAITEKAKCVEAAKQKYIEIAEEFEGLAEQLESAKKRLDEVRTEYGSIVDSNNSYRKILESAKGEKGSSDEDNKLANDIRLKLKLYKKLTGIRFDFNASDDDLSGFVIVKGDNHHHSDVMPFSFKKSSPNLISFMWEKIREVLHTNAEDY